MIFTFTLHLHKMETIAKFMPVPPYLQCIQKYKGLIEPLFDYCSAVWDGLTQQLSEKLQNFKIWLSELLPNLAMILVPDFFLTRLVGIIYRLQVH